MGMETPAEPPAEEQILLGQLDASAAEHIASAMGDTAPHYTPNAYHDEDGGVSVGYSGVDYTPGTRPAQPLSELPPGFIALYTPVATVETIKYYVVDEHGVPVDNDKPPASE